MCPQVVRSKCLVKLESGVGAKQVKQGSGLPLRAGGGLRNGAPREPRLPG